MGSIAREEGVLKLIHPGGYIETHRKPIVASQVMARKPRHYVTRPDVFKFPYIVVSPDSVLRPGDVFFILPWKTLHQLINSATNKVSPVPTPVPAQQVQTQVVPKKSCLKNNNLISRGHKRVRFYLPAEGCCSRSSECCGDSSLRSAAGSWVGVQYSCMTPGVLGASGHLAETLKF